MDEGLEMNIHHFENYINKTILDRGYNYYFEGNVVEAYEQGENEYIFQIEGSDDYEVVVKLGDNGDIVYSECDCPYDFGPVCKHEVAAYFQLDAMLKQATTKKNKRSKANKRPTIHEVLTNLSKEELINIITDIANNDVSFKKSMIVKYSNNNTQHELKSCQELIRSIVRKYTGREGFIKYRDTSAFVREMDILVEKARNTENILLALDIALLLLKEAIGAFQYADDSGGDIGFLVTETLELIEEISTDWDEIDHHRTEVFEKLFAHIDHEVFEGWSDFKVDLLKICIEFADDEAIRNQLRMKMESMLDLQSGDRHMHYNNESVLQLLFQLIEQFGSQEEAEQFIHKNLQFSSFREQLLNKYLQDKNYHQIIEVAIEGETQDQQYPGLLSQWKKYRYQAYKFLSLKAEQQSLAKELLFAGDFEYYQELKQLKHENQEEFYLSLKQELKKQNGWNTTRIFLKLIEEENDLEEILDFVRDDPSYIEEYAERLVNPFKEEVIEIYKRFIQSIAKTSSNRKDYQKVCHRIKKYKKIAGKPNQVELINELMGLYNKRPAFLDELGKMQG
jgi:hypothetical protein